MVTWPKFAHPSWPTEIAVRRYTGLSWNATGPISRHQSRNRGCHDCNARGKRLSSARPTLLGMVESTSTRLVISYSLSIEDRARAGTEARQRALRSDRVRSLEHPVLPCREPGEDLRLHRFRADEAVVGLHRRQRIRRERVALCEHHRHFVVPVDLVGRERDEFSLEGRSRVQVLADHRPGILEDVVAAPESTGEPRQAVRHGVPTVVGSGQSDRRRRPTIALTFTVEHH